MYVDPRRLEYARPGTIRSRQNWRPWAAAVLWLLVVLLGVVLAVPPSPVERLPPIVVILGAGALIAFMPTALIAGFFIFPRPWRDSAVAILLMGVVILLPIIMWLRAGTPW